MKPEEAIDYMRNDRLRRGLKDMEKNAIIENMKKEAMKECKPFVDAFAECAQGRTLSVAWACRPAFRAMNKCVEDYNTVDRLERMFNEYTQTPAVTPETASDAPKQ
eukprot:TRINITY_DN2191_c0_g1_i2.p2 TRINITY_DN2191_c0_g1~~TRINITY_DN2191_c0_g1_i2.p2  ORF type:complete len:106 (+),score=19.69 TRINITY_DN2191_c0_g1_i2:124-441(+)